MIIRIVRMTFRETALDEFHELFEGSVARIRSFPGCRHLELWKDVDSPAVRTTFSMWESENDLASYRNSDLFRTTWAKAKSLFAEPAAASSHMVVEPDPANDGLE